MIEVNLSLKDLNEAKAHHEYMQKLKGHLDSTVAGTKGFHGVGFLGELAAKRYFDYIGMDYKESDEEYAEHAGDSCDFYYGKGYAKKGDVKSSKKYRGIVLNHAQYWKTKYKEISTLVAVHFPNENMRTALILGYGTWSMLKRDEDKDFIRGGWGDDDKSGNMYSIDEDKLHRFKVDNITL